MDILQDIGSAATGNINKAMLFVKKINSSSGKSLSDLREDLLSNNGPSLFSEPKEAIKSLSNMSRAEAIGGTDYHVMQVKYNPSSIRFSTQAGSFVQSGPGGMGVNQITQITVPARTTMYVDLIFDDMNVKDAFMWEKFDLTTGGVASSIGGVAKQLIEDGYTVSNQIDGLIALITQAYSRNVVFYWNEMAFVGEVTGINAKYTMFNPQGNPVRGKVSLSIFQSEDANNTADNKYWDKAFNNLFGKYYETTSVNDASMIDKVQNLINF